MPSGDLLNALDRWRERQRWLPASLDDAAWKTWLWHSAVTAAGGYAIQALTPLDASAGLRLMVGVYFVREVLNVRQLRREGKALRPLDHVMDVAAPLIVAELVIRL